jgi:PAS domain-containing protein
VLKQFELAPGDNLSASASDPAAAGRKVRFYQNGRPVNQEELPLQRSVAENRDIPCVELEVQLPSGRSWMAECYGAPVRDAKGNVVGGVAVTVDVSGRKMAEQQILEAHQKLEHVLTSITDGLLVLDREFRYTYFNEQGARMVGMRPEEIVGRCVWELFPHAKGSRFFEGFQRSR